MRLELRGISAGYGGAPVLREVDLVVPDGSVVALLGANGAGKTTLLRVASGLLRPARGRVLIDGLDRTGSAPHRIARVGLTFVPGDRGVFRGLSVRQNLALQVPADQRDGFLDRTCVLFPRLGDHLDRPAGSLSGGEQQMLALARAWADGASCVLLDEISMGLAPKVVEDIFRRLRALASTGRSLLVVEQYASRAVQLADIVAVLNQGQLAFCGEPAELDGVDLFDRYLGTAM
jgi:branched-chain amino acid transport system ATP-binding protein